MTAMMPDPRELAAVPAGRRIRSFHLALDRTGRLVSLKTRTADGRTEAVVLSAPVALHVRDRLRETLRARPGLAELPTDTSFFAEQPAHETADWNAESPHVGVARGAHLETATEGCVLAFPVDAEGRYTAYRLSPLHAAYLLHALNHAEEEGGLGTGTAEEAGATVH